MLRPTIDEDSNPELLEKIVVEKDPFVDKAIELYEHLMFEKDYARSFVLDWENNYQQSSMNVVLTPAQIDFVLQRIITAYSIDDVEHFVTGEYVSNLIQHSYAAGHNTFTISTKDTKMDYLGSYLKGTSRNKIAITIQGTIGDFFAQKSTWCDIVVHGDVADFCGHYSQYCDYFIHGDVAEQYGALSERCTHKTTNLVTYKNMQHYKKKTKRYKRKNVYLLDNNGIILEHT